jgi:hypothetical protein
MLTEKTECHLIASTPHFVNSVVEHGIVVLPRKIFRSIEEGGILMEEGGPIGLVGMCRGLVAKHHQGTWHMVSVVEIHDLSHGVCIDHLGPEPCPTPEHPWFKHLVAQRFPHSYPMVKELHIERGDHILPTIVMGGHEDNRPALIEIRSQEFTIFHPIALHNTAGRCKEVVDALHQQITQMVVETVLYIPQFSFILLGEGCSKIPSNNFLSIAYEPVCKPI